MSQTRPSKSDLWAGRFQQFRRSEVSIARFCRSEGVSVSAFYYWAKQLRVDTSRKTRTANPGLRRQRADNLQKDAPSAPNPSPNDKGDAYLEDPSIRIAIGTEITMFVPVSHAEVIPQVMRSLLSDQANETPRSEVPLSSFQEVFVRSQGTR
jgi:hypothetical protein